MSGRLQISEWRPLARFLLVLVLVACAGLPVAGAVAAESVPRERVVMGWVEYVAIEPWGLRLKAKLDSGAKTSSMHAQNIEHFRRSGDRWVRFRLESQATGKGERHTFTMERPLVREVRIKAHGGSLLSRPVVTLDFCLNGSSYETQFTLTDRSNFLYPVLLGRRFLEHVALIDPGATYLATSVCEGTSKVAQKKDGKKKR